MMSCGRRSIYPTNARCSRLAQPVCFAQFIDLRWLLHKTTPPTMEETTVLSLKGGDVHTDNTYKPHKQPLHSDNNADCMLSMHACIYMHYVQCTTFQFQSERIWHYIQPPFASSWFPLAHILHIPEWGHQVLWFYNFICAIWTDLTPCLKREAKLRVNDIKINAN